MSTEIFNNFMQQIRLLIKHTDNFLPLIYQLEDTDYGFGQKFARSSNA